MFKKYRPIILFLIVVIAFGLRLCLIRNSSLDFSHDEGTFNILADSILKNRVFSYDGVTSSAWKPPGYPFFLASVYFLSNHSYLIAKIIQALMSSFLCIFIYLIGRKLFSETIGLISASILALNFTFISMPESFLSENLFVFLFSIAILYMTKMRDSASITNKIMFGLFLGLAALTRAEIIFFPFFVGLCMLLKGLTDKIRLSKIIKDFVVIVLFFFLPIIPWTIRNYYVQHTFIPVCTQGGVGLYASFCPLQGKIFGSTPNDDVIRKSREIPESQLDSYFLKETIKFIKNNPAKLFKLTVLKILYFFSPFEYEFSASRTPVYNAIFVFYLPFFIWGFFLASKRVVELLPLYLPIFYYFLLAIVFYGSPRWRSCVEIFMIAIAAFGISRFIETSRKKYVAYGLILCFLIININVFMYSGLAKLGLKLILEQLNLW